MKAFSETESTTPSPANTQRAGTPLLSFTTIALATLVMLLWTWRTWPDALYDFGSQLCYPWQITRGENLYTDIAYFNGPLSQYVNAAAFKLFGVGLSTLIWLNLTILTGVLILLFRLMRALADYFTATVACLGFVLVFAFSQYVGIGNYNWICPYTHEVTHGVALSLAAIAAMWKFSGNGKSRWLWLAGVLLGLVFLTKAEVFAPAALAVGLSLLLHSWTPPRDTGLWPVRVAYESPTPRPLESESSPHGPDFGELSRAEARVTMKVQKTGPFFRLVIFSIATLLPIAIAFALLTIKMPPATAARAVLGSWPWAFDSRIAQLQFYRQGLGTDDLPANLLAMLEAAAIYLITIALAFIAAKLPARLRGISWLIAGLLAGSILMAWQSIPQIARPWPLFMAIIAIAETIRAWKNHNSIERTSILRAMLAIFALGLMGKMLFNARIAQYGFALAMPAAMLLVDILLNIGPKWVQQRGGSARIARMIGLTLITTVVAVHLWANHLFIQAKTTQVGEGADYFWAGARGDEVETARRALDTQFPANSTLAVMPQGLMLNYLTRRENPSPFVNLMPPEMLSAGEDRVLAALIAKPPDIIILTRKDIGEHGFILTEGRLEYGQKTLAWVIANYQQIGMLSLPNGQPPELGLIFYKKK